MELLLGIDVGTTSLKTGLFTSDGRCLGIERQEYQLDTPSAERAQVDAKRYWQACVQTVQSLLERVGEDPAKISALAVSSQGETILTLNVHGEPIYPAMVWLDNRAVSQAERLAQRFKDVVYERTGVAEIIPTWSACKVLWLKENEPDVFAQAAKFLLVQDYLIYRLTGCLPRTVRLPARRFSSISAPMPGGKRCFPRWASGRTNCPRSSTREQASARYVRKQLLSWDFRPIPKW